MEEIEISSPEDTTLLLDEENVKIEQVNFEFHQASKLKGEEFSFTVFNNQHCYQKVKDIRGKKYKFRVALPYLDPKPLHKLTIAENWMFASAVSAIASYVLIYLGWFSEYAINMKLILIATPISLALFLIFLLVALVKTSNRTFIVSQFGQVPILEMIRNAPNKHEFADFLDQFSRSIKSSQSALYNKKNRLRGELKELRRLKNETVITEKQYEAGKSRILSNRAFNDISVNPETKK